MRFMTRRSWLDATLILLLTVASLGDALHAFGRPDDKMILTLGSAAAVRIYVVGWLLAGVPAAVAIVLRHRRPLTAMLMAAGSTAVHLLAPLIKAPPIDVAALVAMYALAGSTHARRTVMTVLAAAQAALFAVCLANVINARGRGPRDGLLDNNEHWFANVLVIPLDALKAAAVPGLLLAATWAVADNARTRRDHLATLQARAADLEREHQQRIALAVLTERGRITREMHDVVAHGLSVIVVQALGARTMLTRQPERAATALTNIIATGRASLAEMRGLLGLVRAEVGAPRSPQPSLATLPELIDRVRDSGTPVDFQVTGKPTTVPATIELAAYRIVQEALTNTLKHATPGACCTVAVHFSPAALDIRVADSGASVPPTAPGNGLRGITERVHALGGELRAGPAAGGGFEVMAQLPVTVGTTPGPVTEPVA